MEEDNWIATSQEEATGETVKRQKVMPSQSINFSIESLGKLEEVLTRRS